MSNHHPRSGPHQHQKVAERFDQRAVRLRKQANIFLGIIIAVLVSGAAAFVFANDIASLSLQPQTAETQYATVKAAIKQNDEQIVSLHKQISGEPDQRECELHSGMRHLRREDELPSRYVEPEGAAVSI